MIQLLLCADQDDEFDPDLSMQLDPKTSPELHRYLEQRKNRPVEWSDPESRVALENDEPRR
jgi:hypothetical protein